MGDAASEDKTKKKRGVNAPLFLYSEPGSNRYGHYCPQDFKSGVSTYSTIRATACLNDAANLQYLFNSAKSFVRFAVHLFLSAYSRCYSAAMSSATAVADTPSSRPSKPRRSVVVAFTDMRSVAMPTTSDRR